MSTPKPVRGRGAAKRQRKLTIKDVAKIAGVGVGTVSRVLNNHSSVDPLVRSRIQRIVRDLSYAPDRQAQALRRGSTLTVGVILRDVSITHLTDFVRGAQEVLDPMGYMVFIGSAEEKARELELLERVRQRKVSGLIMSTCVEEDAELDAARQRLDAPIVFLDREVPGKWGVVAVRHEEAMANAVNYLLELGHRRIGLITGNPQLATARNRIKGFMSAHRRWGVAVRPELIRCGGFAGDQGQSDCTALLTMRVRPTAIIAGGFNILNGILHATKESGLRNPQDVSLIGSGDSPLAQLSTPPVTVLHWDMNELGKLAAQRLLQRIISHGKGEELIRTYDSVPATLIVRGSCTGIGKRPRGVAPG